MTQATEEQERLSAELLKRYGPETFKRALQISGIRACLSSLATDALTREERHDMFVRAVLHVDMFQSSVLKLKESQAITECAMRMDAAISMWVLDGIEEKVGELGRVKPRS